MTATIPPEPQHDAAPDLGAAQTVDDLWALSDMLGIPAGALLAATKQFVGRHL